MTMKKLFITLLLLAVLCVGLAGAETSSAPLLPAQYYGTAVTENGDGIPAGTVITAELDGNTYTCTLSSPGKIGEPGTFGSKFIISPPGSSAEGKPVTFRIGSIPASQTVSFSAGDSAQLALTFGIDVPPQDTSSGNHPASQSSVIVTNNSIPVGFLLPITDVTPAEQAALPPVPTGSTVFTLVDITPVNPPAGPYTIIITFTLTAADLAGLNAAKDKIAVFHHNERTNIWETVPTYIHSENPDGSVTYDTWLSSFSAFMIASSPAGSTAPFSPGGSVSSPVTAVPTPSAVVTVTPVQTSAAVQTNVPTAVSTNQPGVTENTAGQPDTETGGTDNGLVTLLIVVIGILSAVILIIGVVWIVKRRNNRDYL